jgi:hypothetical protein
VVFENKLVWMYIETGVTNINLYIVSLRCLIRNLWSKSTGFENSRRNEELLFSNRVRSAGKNEYWKTVVMLVEVRIFRDVF